MQNRVKKAATILVLSAFTITCMPPVTTVAASSITDLQGQQKDLNSKKKDLKGQINAKAAEKRDLTAELSKINSDLNAVQQNIEGLNSEISATEEKISATQTEINNKQRDYDGRMAIFNQRLKQMYQYGDVNFMEVLLQSSSFTDFLTRFEYMKYIADNDQQLLEEVSAMKANLETEKKNLNSMKNSLEVKKKDQEVKSQELVSVQTKKENLVAQISSEQNEMFKMLDQMEAEARALNSQIKKLQAEAAARAAREAAKNGKTVSNKAPGAYTWPLPSSHTITSGYGYRTHPVSGQKKLHTGIDIGAGYGSPIVAAADGVVIMAQYNGGYGNCIIVDHGGGVATLYGHMSSFVARTGQTVKAGQTIGKVGSTGVSTGNHLHFEVRINGSTVNPRGYV